MNKQTAGNYVIGSVMATMFIGLGFGIAIASSSTPSFFVGLVLGIVGLVVVFTLLRKVKKAGYKIRIVKEGDEIDA